MKRSFLVCVCAILLFAFGCTQGNLGRTTVEGCFVGVSELLYKNTLYYNYEIGDNEILIPERNEQPAWELGYTYRVTYKTHDYSAEIIAWEEIQPMAAPAPVVKPTLEELATPP